MASVQEIKDLLEDAEKRRKAHDAGCGLIRVHPDYYDLYCIQTLPKFAAIIRELLDKLETRSST